MHTNISMVIHTLHLVSVIFSLKDTDIHSHIQTSTSTDNKESLKLAGCVSKLAQETCDMLFWPCTLQRIIERSSSVYFSCASFVQ